MGGELSKQTKALGDSLSSSLEAVSAFEPPGIVVSSRALVERWCGSVAPTAAGVPAVAECVVTTVAGTLQGRRDGPANQAEFNWPFGVDVDTSGALYVVERDNNAVRKIARVFGDDTGACTRRRSGGSRYQVTTLAGRHKGDHDGLGATAQFHFPTGICVDRQGTVYVADQGNHKIRTIDACGHVGTLAGRGFAGHLDGPGHAAKFSRPHGLCVDRWGTVFVADQGNYRIRRVAPSSSTRAVSTMAGRFAACKRLDGPAQHARFNWPTGVAVDRKGNVYVADCNNHQIRRIDHATAMVSTLAGRPGRRGYQDGLGTTAMFNYPSGVAVDAKTGHLYVADSENHKVRRIVISASGAAAVTTVAGHGQGFQDGPGAVAKLYCPKDVAVDRKGNLFVADSLNHKIRMIRFPQYWRFTNHSNHFKPLRNVVYLVLAVQTRLDTQGSAGGRGAGGVQVPGTLWLPTDVWFLIFEFLHDSDFDWHSVAQKLV